MEKLYQGAEGYPTEGEVTFGDFMKKYGGEPTGPFTELIRQDDDGQKQFVIVDKTNRVAALGGTVPDDYYSARPGLPPSP